jgi:glycosyltransferase involved in cell wall biosynthesis
LVEALGAGKPVIATAFPHAQELLADGAGIVVPHSDPVAMSAAVRRVFEIPVSTARMASKARVIGSTMYWPVVARRYQAMATTLAQDPDLRTSLARVG